MPKAQNSDETIYTKHVFTFVNPNEMTDTTAYKFPNTMKWILGFAEGYTILCQEVIL